VKNPRATFSGDEEVSAGASVTTGRDSGASSPGEMGQRSLPTTNNAVLGTRFLPPSKVTSGPLGDHFM
jgi:hypothetical protein